MIHIGTAGWSIPRSSADQFPGIGTHLQRYARVLTCAEINSSFHRPHAATTYAKWASMAPPEFRFAVKVPRTITHDAHLRRTRSLIDQFLGEVAGLGERLGPLLVQLPPSLEFRLRIARSFFDLLRARHPGWIVCEPRHETWFSAAAERLMVEYRVGRVAADPSRIKLAKVPGGWAGITYFRLHGSPRKYWSRYPRDRVKGWADQLRRVPAGSEAWCIFDNTASGAATQNALEMLGLTAE